ncbi:MAG: sugar ABC transporter permease [Ruminococcaceae bacterium]|jgi:ABC-type sugar transport system permease subunit|nr:sugar ABC transporter permease [Oscillospiraceae bacterium]
MNDELEFGTAASSDTPEPAVELNKQTESVPEAPVQRVSAHNTAAAAALNAANEEVDIRRKGGEKAQIKIKTTKIPYEKKKGLYGYGFIALWFIGTLWLFIIPVLTSLWYSLCDTQLLAKADALEKGMTSAGIYTEFNGFKNFVNAFTVDTEFLPKLGSSLGEILPNTLVIMIFSLFIAVILNQKFRGRTLARAIFFLPVLIATGPVISVINGDMTSQGISDASQFSTLFKTDLVTELMEFIGIYNLNQTFTDVIKNITSDVLNLVWNSGIQILIFLSALQTIPPSAKEAASIEGATAWEFFWKITFPYISPMILSNLVYTVIDAFVSTDNQVMEYVLKQSGNWEYGYAAALAWIYFAIVGACLGLICVIINRFVYYEND